MRKVVYVGAKPLKTDNVAGTGLSWKRGEILEVEDDAKAEKLLSYAGIWADAEQPYQMQPTLSVVEAKPEISERTAEPTVEFVADGHEPVTFMVSAEVLQKLREQELIPVFMTTDQDEQCRSYLTRLERARQAREAKEAKKAA